MMMNRSRVRRLCKTGRLLMYAVSRACFARHRREEDVAATSSDVIRDYEIFGPSRLRNRERAMDCSTFMPIDSFRQRGDGDDDFSCASIIASSTWKIGRWNRRAAASGRNPIKERVREEQRQ